MSNLNFLHFDTALKDISTDDPFNCTLTLANPMRHVKKIYLKSCEIPIGFFNIRESYTFSFRIKFPVIAYKLQTVVVNNNNGNGATPTNSGIYGGGGLIATPVDPDPTNTTTITQPIVSPLTGGKNYNWSPEAVSNYVLNGIVPVSGSNNGSDGVLFQINVIPGNYTIDSLIAYINTAIDKIYQKCFTDLELMNDFNTSPTLTKLTVSDTGAFPVGYVQFNYYPGFIVSGFNSNFLTNCILGFQTNQTDSTLGSITARYLWSIYNDLSIALYFANIPHNNTHFSSQLMSFKIPIKGGVQSIEFNGDSQNFSQYIEISDPHYILSQIKLVIFDTRGNLLKNQYNFNFTLGFEYYN
jgi:hypothetical protein